MNNDNAQKTPHPHAALIKAWADGAQIQFLNDENEWTDTNTPNWNENTEYRIKPEAEEPKWRPKEGETYWWINRQGVLIRSSCVEDCDRDAFNYGNCFRTPEAAEEAAQLVKALLLAIRENKPFAWNRESVVKENLTTEIDGKPLSLGEVELIKALRDFEITKIFDDEESILVGGRNGNKTTAYASHIAFWGKYTDEDCEERVREALKQIKEEQEANK